MGQEQGDEKLESLLKILAGYEVSVLLALENRDYEILPWLKEQRSKCYQKLRGEVYGITQGTSGPTKEG